MSTARKLEQKTTPKRKPLEWDLAAAYRRVFGLDGARARCVYTSKSIDPELGFLPYRRSYQPSWKYAGAPPRDVEIALSFFDSVSRVAPREMQTTRYLVIDVDVHGTFPRAPVPAGTNVIDLFASPRGARLEKLHARRQRASVARPVLDELRARVAFDVVEITPRGWHLVIVFDTDVAVTLAAAIGGAVVANLELPEGVAVEVFPKVRADGLGDHCSAPLLGPAFRVASDYVTRDGMRRAVLEEVLHAEFRSPEDLAHELGIDLDGAPTIVTVTAPQVEEPAVDASLRHVEAPAVDGQLFGSTFAAEARALLEHGLPAGGSYDGIRRVAFAAFAVGLTDDQIIDAITTWLEEEDHDADHAQTKAGRRQLLRVLRANLRHYATGEQQGRLRRGGMRSRVLRRIFKELLAHGPATKRVTACSTTNTGARTTMTEKTATASCSPGMDPSGSREARTTYRANSLTFAPSQAAEASTSRPRGLRMQNSYGSSRRAERAAPSPSPSRSFPEVTEATSQARPDAPRTRAASRVIPLRSFGGNCADRGADGMIQSSGDPATVASRALQRGFHADRRRVVDKDPDARRGQP